MVNVFLTIDTEIWCHGWSALDQNFPDAFKRYVYGTTKRGCYGLPLQLRILNDYGLTGVFFVETLFARRFGKEPLKEIVSLIKEAKQEVQLHIHTEWVNEVSCEDLPKIDTKRQYLFQFNRSEQTKIIAAGLKDLKEAGEDKINAFRAGNFGFNTDTLFALRTNEIIYDTSYNATILGPESGLPFRNKIWWPIEFHGVFEYPMAIFIDGLGKMRHAQLGSCSFREISESLLQAVSLNHKFFVILMHNFELLNRSLRLPDKIVTRRFEKLCKFLSKNDDLFRVEGFRSNRLNKSVYNNKYPLLKVSRNATIIRSLQQLARRLMK